MIDCSDVEFHRSGYGLLPADADKDPGRPICFPRAPDSPVFTGLCDCRASRKNGECPHLDRLIRLAARIRKGHGGLDWGEVFARSFWQRLAQVLTEGDPVSCAEVRVAKQDRAFEFLSPRGSFLARSLDPSEAPLRFLERAGKMPQGTTRGADRAAVLKRLADCQRSEEERMINEAGVLTRRQAVEQGFWGRLACHCFREYGNDGTFRPAIEKGSGDFMLRIGAARQKRLLEISVPRPQVRAVLRLLAAEFPGRANLAIHPVPLRSVFLLAETSKQELEVRPVIESREPAGEPHFYEEADSRKFRYGTLVYLPEKRIMAELTVPGAGSNVRPPSRAQLERSRLPSFLDEHRQALEAGLLVLDQPLRHISILREYDRMEIVPDALERSWYWLSVRYGFGSDSVTLAEVLRARLDGERYLEAGRGWVDVRSDAFRALDGIEKRASLGLKADRVGLSAAELLGLVASNTKPVRMERAARRAEIFERFLALTPAKPLGALKGMTTALRPYQAKGLDWLRFLFENGLGGLLCDDMGLGKTHQAMALMVWLLRRPSAKGPFLVVCPKTVIGHWMQKLGEHAPVLKAAAHHGGERDLDRVLRRARVIVTSYTVLRLDAPRLARVPFALAVFDEIQNLKNRETQGYQAAALLRARMKIGLTGTPLENSVSDIKSLFDLILPGYLESDEEFAARYTSCEKPGAPEPATPELRRRISPFVLRRLKGAVLDELPEKIEDLRTCSLSEAQVRLYREALSAKGSALLQQLESDARKLPYIHIFALLNLLKRICDHPALALGRVEAYREYESGKWDLFVELLSESLDNGQKVVVFSQYLGMIAMMERQLAEMGTGFVALTGASEGRAEIVRRFNEEKSCRVFLGSLKAGGSGIDLVAGSVVIHYDRWWNAAREDQATDRVHRIGQKSAVQVFKLVAQGTLEEKIAAIIERKRRLMDSVVQADDPAMNKIFTREELIDLLRPV